MRRIAHAHAPAQREQASELGREHLDRRERHAALGEAVFDIVM